MSMNGIWSAELYGVYGWENIGIVILESGRVISGGDNHYAIGTCGSTGKNKLSVSLTVDYFGTPRRLFGDTTKHARIAFQGQRKGDRIRGEMWATGKPKLSVTTRLTRQSSLPPVSA